MKQLVKRVLVCYDGSEGSKKALELAKHLARLDEQTEFDFLSVIKIQLPYDMYPGALIMDEQSLVTEYETYADGLLDGVVKEWGLPNPIHSYVVEGSPVEEILSFAKKGKNDLIIIGNRSLSPVKELFLGSVSHHVAQQAACPVLIAK
ncbi:universal stress protein [Pullulanibacillus sp. KACC 23026]|uniref:universal stress protein n=1 Tax=Pullulanibacillus sp. KACC 23026 TaxID=3028315 RepID=UPI0023AEAA7A|nr:universal stress protein [Pullulanibacillus sp. KACC 23026]WEG13805.1 universal stress protein [Pullulanibacillus sp. KACC 23026]